jgi:hypothetical protein
LRGREGEQRGDPDRQPDRGKEAEHADRDHQPDDDRDDADQADGDADAGEAAAEVGIEPLPLAAGGLARGPAALIGAAQDDVGVADRPVDLLARPLGALEAVVGALENPAEFGWVHLLSIGVNGEAAPSSLAWFTPSARAI